MKDNKKVLSLLGVGLDSELAQKAVAAGFTLIKLRRASKRELAQHFSDEEVDSIWKLVKREPIPAETLQRLVEECDWKCCVCWNYRKELCNSGVDFSRYLDRCCWNAWGDVVRAPRKLPGASPNEYDG